MKQILRFRSGLISGFEVSGGGVVQAVLSRDRRVYTCGNWTARIGNRRGDWFIETFRTSNGRMEDHQTFPLSDGTLEIHDDASGRKAKITYQIDKVIRPERVIAQPVLQHAV